MAQGHSVDEYLETIYFLAFPIGEYTPRGSGSPPLASRVAEMLGVSRASAGEMLKRLEADGLVERGEKKEALLARLGAGLDRIGSFKVEKFITTDGYKFLLPHGEWVAFRASGTEPLIRCYIEAKSNAQLKKLKVACQNLLKA